MTEKDIWKWLLDRFSDEGLASLASVINLKVPGFRQINPKLKNFKLLRPKLIQEAVGPKNLSNLKDFFDTFYEEKSDVDYRCMSLDELLEAAGEEVAPSMLMTVLLSSDQEEHIQNALDLFEKLTKEGTLEELEKQANEKNADEDDEEEEESEEDESEVNHELILANKKAAELEKRLKKSEQKNEALKAQIAAAQTSFDLEKKQWKEEKKKLTEQTQALSRENGKHKNEAAAALKERDALAKQLEQQQSAIKQKNDEIARLNALVLKLKTESQKQGPPTEEPIAEASPIHDSVEVAREDSQLNVAVIGDPKNSRVQRYKKFNLTIIEASELEEEKNTALLETADFVWLLTYRIPRGVQKRIKSMVEGKKIQEFATFIDLENHMKKG